VQKSKTRLWSGAKGGGGGMTRWSRKGKRKGIEGGGTKRSEEDRVIRYDDGTGDKGLRGDEVDERWA